MKRWLFLTYLLVFSGFVQAQQVQVVKWEKVQKLLQQNSDTTYIINFWATWCKPCVAELPTFKQLNEHYSGQKVRVLLVSMDFAKDLTARVQPFVERWQINNPVWLLNEPDYDSWINKVSRNWSGAIPATLILNNQKRKRIFFEQSLEYDRLVKELNEFL